MDMVSICFLGLLLIMYKIEIPVANSMKTIFCKVKKDKKKKMYDLTNSLGELELKYFKR